jgi:TolB-like protein/cytochrome c-type biogenesis protein CcmH/NrfG
VLPFVNMSSDKEQEYFSEGISEELLNLLSRIPGLKVAARTSSFSFKGKSIEIREIANKLNVPHVLEGSVRRAGSRVRITAQLIEASTGYRVWSERYDRQLEDIFDVQDEIARTIVERLKIAFSAGPERLIKTATTNMEAYQLYLKGRALLYKRGTWIAHALDTFRQAVDLDPGYGDAWAGLADAYSTHGYYGFAPSSETFPRALDAATKAVAIDPSSATAHGALALAVLLWDRDFETAEREFQRALTINPAYTQARCWYGLMYLQGSVADRLDEGVEEARRAVGFDPLSGYAVACYSYALAQARRTSEAVIQARVAVQRDPESFIAYWTLGNACHWDQQFDEAVAAYERLLAISGRHPWGLAGLAATCASLGKQGEARALHAELMAQRAIRYVQPTTLAISASAVGDHEAAIDFCRSCVEERDSLFGIVGQHFIDLERVRADARFAEITAQFDRPGAAAGRPKG